MANDVLSEERSEFIRNPRFCNKVDVPNHESIIIKDIILLKSILIKIFYGKNRF